MQMEILLHCKEKCSSKHTNPDNIEDRINDGMEATTKHAQVYQT